MRTFTVVRMKDETGVSGSGVVAEACEWSDGRVAVHWLSNIKSTTAYDSLDDAIKVHGHNGCTQFVENKVKSL